MLYAECLLTALDFALANDKNLPEKQRILVRNSICNIRNIANNLLVQYKTFNIINEESQDGSELIVRHDLFDISCGCTLPHTST